MIHKPRLFFKSSSPKFHQKGAALILIMFIIGLGAAAYMLKALNASNLQAEQDKKTYQALNSAKLALISWAVNHPNTPGLMPYPDRNQDGNYDDTSDCYASNVSFASHFTLGRLPLFKNDPNCINAKITVNSGLADDFRDSAGERLWYEVSRNLVHDYKSTVPNPDGVSPIVNPSIVNTPTYPWFVVRDRNGAIISNRVAAVIISPGLPSGGQDRSGGIANANQYLDKIVMADGTPYQNYGYQDTATNLIQEFIVGDHFKTVAKNDPTYKDQTIEPYYYNDKVVYITIDELMYALEKRVLMEAKTALNSYYVTNGYYPFAAGSGSTTNTNQCTQGNLRGLLPVVTSSPHTCTCTAGDRTCRCNFSVIRSVTFTRNSGNFVADGGGANAPTGSCSVQVSDTTKCTCNGEGSCKRASGAIQFSCDACGVCKATVAGTNNFDTSGAFTSAAATGSCSSTPIQSLCSNAADGAFTLAACDANETIKSLPSAGGLLPAWFMANAWEKHIVYAVSSDCASTGTCATTTSPPKLTVGFNQNVNAILAASVVNPNNACNISNYLSSAENTNMVISNGMQDTTYQKTQSKTQINTDQLVVMP